MSRSFGFLIVATALLASPAWAQSAPRCADVLKAAKVHDDAATLDFMSLSERTYAAVNDAAVHAAQDPVVLDAAETPWSTAEKRFLMLLYQCEADPSQPLPSALGMVYGAMRRHSGLPPLQMSNT